MKKNQAPALSCRQKSPSRIDQHQSQLFREGTEVFFKSLLIKADKDFCKKVKNDMKTDALLLHLAPNLLGRHRLCVQFLSDFSAISSFCPSNETLGRTIMLVKNSSNGRALDTRVDQAVFFWLFGDIGDFLGEEEVETWLSVEKRSSWE